MSPKLSALVTLPDVLEHIFQQERTKTFVFTVYLIMTLEENIKISLLRKLLIRK